VPRTRRATTPAGEGQRSKKQARQAEREIIVTLRLPRELHARLQALGGPRGLTAEIRNRLETSLGGDPRTRRLLDAIAAVAEALPQTEPVSRMLGLDAPLGPWHEDPISYAALVRDIPRLMELIALRPSDAVDEDTLKPIADMALGAGLRALMTVSERPAEDEGSEP